ncbi:MAG: twin-arginine translocase TatA/TatE family subunit [Candidatus Marinimicrobia bacterium]|jgi:sec-independent protein translocase protein TatA|nr:twin-arginine translocase TatA/TatE family subunit [Candidatus Neomarinimicrobiota bacterium]
MSLGPWEVVIILVVVLIIFGGKKLPELARGLGQGLKEFKKATKDIKDEVENTVKDIDEETPKKDN